MSSWKSFQLHPEDVLFFRDGNPSTPDDHYLRSLFPPNPSTVFGAVRTRRLVDLGVDLARLHKGTWGRVSAEGRAELGEWGGFGTLTMRGPWLVRNGEALVPVPSDLALVPDLSRTEPEVEDRRDPRRKGLIEEPFHREPQAVVRFRRIGMPEEGGHSHSLGLLAPFEADGPWKGDRDPRPATGWFMNRKGLAAWRQGKIPRYEDLVAWQELWCDEPRTGLGLEETERRARDGMLFTFGYIRLVRGVSIGFEISGGGLEAGGSVRLGGGGKTCEVTEGPEFPKWDPELDGPEPAAGEPFRLSLLTPSLSRGGGYPPGFGPDRRQAEIACLSCSLQAAVVTGAVQVGGWDVSKHRAKPLRRALPAGSVFVMQGTGSPSCLDGFRWSDYSDEGLAHQGFGTCLLGRDF